ncbi:hypothetical protein AK812_SmicGene396 [Symbiodinium microadriaticum]|uniref:Uncharacterized protein n=1 Tax=Symbiodinium microadriaticum TaxID=2951 RepID=A0A1Q9F6S1_SYMMI|nr:hypothetical protein AK812_SmicGene396 [Symbiodinium microadriaticum]
MGQQLRAQQDRKDLEWAPSSCVRQEGDALWPEHRVPLASAPLTTGLGFERQAAWLLDAVSGQFWWRKASRFRFHTGGSDGELLCKGEGGAVLAQDPGSDPCSLTIAMMLPPGLQLAAHAHVLGERPEATAEDATRRALGTPCPGPAWQTQADARGEARHILLLGACADTPLAWLHLQKAAWLLDVISHEGPDVAKIFDHGALCLFFFTQPLRHSSGLCLRLVSSSFDVSASVFGGDGQGGAQPNTCVFVTLRSTDLDAASQGLETSSDAPQLRATYFSADVAVRQSLPGLRLPRITAIFVNKAALDSYHGIVASCLVQLDWERGAVSCLNFRHELSVPIPHAPGARRPSWEFSELKGIAAWPYQDTRGAGHMP